MADVTLRAPAKLNLFLHVIGKRADGYHEVESLVTFADIVDEISFTHADDLSLIVSGEFAVDAGGGKDNLVLKAARALQLHTGCRRGARITLIKHIPVGAGLGGGSADAAATLNGLNTLWQLGLSEAELKTIAVTLGADVAMCLNPKPAIVRGIGEIVVPLMHKLPPMTALLVHPRVPLLTKDVYGALNSLPRRGRVGVGALEATAEPDNAPLLTSALQGEEFWSYLTRTRNHLQSAAITVSASVAEVLRALETLQPPAKLVRMTGSGACCFALYEPREDADRAALMLINDRPNWWVRISALQS